MESASERIEEIRNQIIPAYKKNPSMFTSTGPKKIQKVELF